MNLTTEQRKIVESVVNVFETGKAAGDYGAVTILPDGPHGERQVTYGRSQVTEHGDDADDLSALVGRYVDARGRLATELGPYVVRVGDPDLCDDTNFLDLLRVAGDDPVMRVEQDRLFDRAYFQPAMAWCFTQGLERPLSALAVYDSWIHSGGVLGVIRRSFREVPPSRGGDERGWTTMYLRARRAWLLLHRNPVVRQTTYRMDFLISLAEMGDWSLEQRPFRCRGTVIL